MKSSIALGLLVGAAFAQPHGHNHLHKRAKVTVYETAVVEVTATILVAQDGSRETVPPVVQPSSDAKFFEHSTSSPSSSSAAPTTTSTSTTSTTSTSTSSSIVIPSSSSVIIPTTTSTYVAPVPTTTSSVVIEVPTTTLAPVVPTTTSQVVAQPTTSASSGGGSGGQFSGDATYFKIGLGSCGGENYSGKDLTQPVVAVSALFHAAHPDACGKSITITGPKGTVTGVISDKCPECTLESIDVAEGLFVTLFGSTGVGRGTVSWSMN